MSPVGGAGVRRQGHPSVASKCLCSLTTLPRVTGADTGPVPSPESRLPGVEGNFLVLEIRLERNGLALRTGLLLLSSAASVAWRGRVTPLARAGEETCLVVPLPFPPPLAV